MLILAAAVVTSTVGCGTSPSTRAITPSTPSGGGAASEWDGLVHGHRWPFWAGREPLRRRTLDESCSVGPARRDQESSEKPGGRLRQPWRGVGGSTPAGVR